MKRYIKKCLFLGAIVVMIIFLYYREITSFHNRNIASFEFNITFWYYEIPHYTGWGRMYDEFRNAIHNPYEEGIPFYELTPFSWTHAYIFKPGTTRAEIEEVIGIRIGFFPRIENFFGSFGRRNQRFDRVVNQRWVRTRRFPRVVREDYTQIIFVNNRASTAWIRGDRTLLAINRGEIYISANIHASTFYELNFGEFGDSNHIEIVYSRSRMRLDENIYYSSDELRELIVQHNLIQRVRVFRSEETDRIVIELVSIE